MSGALSLERIVSLASDLIRRRTTADRPDEREACLEDLLGRLASPDLTVDRYRFEGDPSAIVRPRGMARPRVILCGHLDVVPGQEGQYVPLLEDDRLQGRGALDMKGSMAALAEVFLATAAEGIPWWLLIVTDEEVGGANGAARLAREGLDAELFLAAEPTDLSLSLQSKGALRLEVVHRGRAAHASTPWMGDSSVERMMEIGPLIRKVIPEVTEEAWRTTASLNIIRGGSVINQVPDECSLFLDIRYVPDDDPEEITRAMREALPGMEVKVVDRYPPMVCREDSPLVKSLRETAAGLLGREPATGREHGATDARHFSDRMDALIFGPAGLDLHGPDEWVSVRSLADFAQIMLSWGRTLRQGS